MAADYLQHRGNVWRFYRRVPHDLVPYLGRFWRASLGTSDHRVAEIKVHEHVVRTDHLITETRKSLTGPLTHEDRTLIRDAGGLKALRTMTLGSPAPRIPQDYGLKGAVTVATAAAEMLDATVPVSLPEAAKEGVNLLDSREVADDAHQYAGGRPRSMASVALAVLSKDSRLRLPQASPLGPFAPFANSAARQYAARRFAELFPDLALTKITRQNGVTFVKELARLPASGSPRIRALTIREAIATADQEKLPRLERASVRQIFFRLSAMLNDAANEGAISANPLQGYRFSRSNGTKHSAAKANARAGFTPEEMRKLDAAADKMTDDDRWVFLLGAYQGARREECAQLRVSDIQQRGDVWCMQVTDEAEGQRVKNLQSLRLIPLHSALIDRGFIDYVKNAKGDRLFPTLVPGKKDPRVSALLGKRFATLCASLAIGKSFHGLRHGWKTASRNAGLPEEVAEAICGRRAGSAVASRYGDLADPAVLAPWLNKVDQFADPVA